MKVTTALREHLPEYLMEAWGLGSFMIAAGVVGTILFSPTSPLNHAIPNPLLQRLIMGLGMGLTAIGVMYSPWGKRSGAHINPSVTLTFYRLGKIRFWDAVFYILFQFIGGLIGVLIVVVLLGKQFEEPPVSYIVTVSGSDGVVGAFGGEFIIAFILMIVVLYTSNTANLAAFTPCFSGLLVALYVLFESPLSGFGMNPARTVASAIPSGIWTDIWLYFVAPIAGMLLAAEVYLQMRKGKGKICAKVHHHPNQSCIHCRHKMHNHLRGFSCHKSQGFN